MPFAGYENFAACVAANSDKGDPEAYCATIMRAVEKRNRTRVAELLKHYGPGNHPSGTGQEVHGHGLGQGHAEELLHVPRGFGSLKGKQVPKYLASADGSELLFSYEALAKAEYMVVNDELVPIKPIKGVAKNVAAMETIQANLKKFKLKADDIERNFARLWTSALDRYKANPDLIDQDRFYEQWHESYSLLSLETGMDMESLVAAGAVISPGMDAKANLTYIHDIARFMGQNGGKGPTWEGDDLVKLEQSFRAGAEAILSPKYTEHHIEVARGEKKVGDPREAPSQFNQEGEVGAQWAKAQSMLDAADFLATRDSVSFSELPDDIAARALHFERAYRGAPPGGILGEIAKNPTVTAGINLSPTVGFSVKNFDYYSRAISVLRGTATPDDVLGDVKTRSFFNNIVDFTNASGRDDVTIDFHAADSAFMVRGMAENSTLMSGPKLEGIGLGVRPLVADAIRNLVPRAQASLGRITKEPMSPLRVQEILWAEWQRGQIMGGEKNKTVTHWRSFDGSDVVKLGSVAIG